MPVDYSRIMSDGMPTLVRFKGRVPDDASDLYHLAETDLGATFHAVNVTPPSSTLGDAIDITSMENSRVRVKASKRLIDHGDLTMSGYYSPELYTTFLGMLGVNQMIDVQFPRQGLYGIYDDDDDGTAQPLPGGVQDVATETFQVATFWGMLLAFEPQQHEEGSPPEANLTITISNINEAGVETLPVLSTYPTIGEDA